MIKSELNGFTGEFVDSGAKKHLIYEFEAVSITVSEEGKSKAITVNNVKEDGIEWNEIIQRASAVSNDGQLLHFVIDRFGGLIS